MDIDSPLFNKDPKYITCPSCGSPDVVIDALARWNPTSQKWEQFTVLDSKTCETCGYDGNTFHETKASDLTAAQKAYVEGEEYVKPLLNSK